MKSSDHLLRRLPGWDPDNPSFPSPKRPEPVIHADAADADWIKRGKWDIPADNIPDLREWLFEQQISVEDFKKLDVYFANVERMPWLREL